MVAKPPSTRDYGQPDRMRFTLNAVHLFPFAGVTPGDGHAAPWLNSANAYPRSVGYLVSPLYTGRRPCCAQHPGRPWLSRTYAFKGYGSVWLSGTAAGNRPGVDLVGDALAGTGAFGLIQMDMVDGPGPFKSADPLERAEFLMNRLRHVLFSLAAQLWYSSRNDDIRRCPLLKRHAAQYETDNGAVRWYRGGSLDMTEPTTYLS